MNWAPYVVGGIQIVIWVVMIGALVVFAVRRVREKKDEKFDRDN